MPKFTPKDLMKFNEGKSKTDWIYIKITNNDTVVVGFCNAKGDILNDAKHQDVKKYYGDAIQPFKEPKNNPLGIVKYISNKPTMPYGRMFMNPSDLDDDGYCLNAYVMGYANASKNWGIMLYELLIILSGNSGLTPDRGLVTEEARNVWEKMLTRSDVKTKELDPIKNIGEIGKKTPDYRQDDCLAKHEKDPGWNKGIDDPEKASEIFNVLNRVYYNNGLTTLEELKSLNLLWDSSKITMTEQLKTLYKSLLR